MTALLAIEKLTVRRGSRIVLDEVSLDVREGEVVGLLGPNGAGKSTLLRAALGLTPIESGRVSLGGESPFGIDRRAIARRAVLLPERAGAGSGLTVREIVRTGRFAHVGAMGRETDADRRAVDDAIASLSLGDAIDRSFDTLSAGERKRVLLARCFAQQAPLFLLDEPTSTLDLGRARALFDAVRSRVAKNGAALVAMHDLGLAAAKCDRIALLRAGSIASSGTPAEVLRSDAIEEAFGARMDVEIDASEVRLRVPRQ